MIAGEPSRSTRGRSPPIRRRPSRSTVAPRSLPSARVVPDPDLGTSCVPWLLTVAATISRSPTTRSVAQKALRSSGPRLQVDGVVRIGQDGLGPIVGAIRVGIRLLGVGHSRQRAAGALPAKRSRITSVVEALVARARHSSPRARRTGPPLVPRRARGSTSPSDRPRFRTSTTAWSGCGTKIARPDRGERDHRARSGPSRGRLDHAHGAARPRCSSPVGFGDRELGSAVTHSTSHSPRSDTRCVPTGRAASWTADPQGRQSHTSR